MHAHEDLSLEASSRLALSPFFCFLELAINRKARSEITNQRLRRRRMFSRERPETDFDLFFVLLRHGIRWKPESTEWEKREACVADVPVDFGEFSCRKKKHKVEKANEWSDPIAHRRIKMVISLSASFLIPFLRQSQNEANERSADDSIDKQIARFRSLFGNWDDSAAHLHDKHKVSSDNRIRKSYPLSRKTAQQSCKL